MIWIKILESSSSLVINAGVDFCERHTYYRASTNHLGNLIILTLGVIRLFVELLAKHTNA